MTDDRPTPHLTKSNYLAGLQCSLRLWKQLHAPRPFVEASPGTPQYEGRRIGELARKCFPGGELVQNPTSDHEGASAQTKRLMMSDCPAIFEGAFEHGNRRVRVDVLKRIGIEKWALYEVKSSTSARNEHCDDAAFQADVLSKSGVALDSITIVHVDSSYRRKPGDIDPTQFFRFVDVTARLSAHFDALGLNLPRMIATLNSEQGPQVPPGPHCWSPRECEFLAQCTESLPRDWIGHLPRISRDQFAEMAAAGVMSIAEIPEQFHLSEVQEVARVAQKTGAPFISPGLQEALRPLGPPALYLDFETVTPGIPLFSDTSPYQPIPFLFSLHIDTGADLLHKDFIAPPGEDPRRGFAEELIRLTSSNDWPILVYSPYEERIIKELQRALPDLTSDLAKIRGRLQDILTIVRNRVYLPAFNGSFSIKKVGPILAPDFTYEDLDIADGLTAAAEYQMLVETHDIPLAIKAKKLAALRSYCERDTYAMVRVHRALIEFGKHPDQQIE